MENPFQYSSMTSDVHLLSGDFVTTDNISNFSLLYNASSSSNDSSGLDATINWTRRFPQLSEDKEYIFDRLTVRVIFIIVYTIVFCSCFFGNLLVILVVTLHWRMRSITNFCLANLAFANLCVGVFCVYQNLSTYLITSWVFGDFMCKMYHFINSLSHTASILILVVICIERYLAIIHPIKSRQILTIRRLRVSIVAVWITSAIYCSPRLYYITTITIPRRDGEIEILCIPKRTLYNSQTFDIINFLLIFLVPMTVISVLYTIIGISLWKSSRNQMSTLSTSTTTVPAASSSSPSSSLPNHIHIPNQSSTSSQIEISSANHFDNNINQISISISEQNQNEHQGFGGGGADGKTLSSATAGASRFNAARNSGRKAANGKKTRSKEREKKRENTSTSEEPGSEESYDGDSFNRHNPQKKKKLSSPSSSRLSVEVEPFRFGFLCCLARGRRRSGSKCRRLTASEKHLNSNPNPISIPNCEDCECEDNEVSTIFHSQISQSNKIHRERFSGEKGPCRHVNVSVNAQSPGPTVLPSISLMTSSTGACDVSSSYGIKSLAGHGHDHIQRSNSTRNTSTRTICTSSLRPNLGKGSFKQKRNEKQAWKDKGKYLYGDGDDSSNEQNNKKETCNENPRLLAKNQGENSLPKMKLRRVGAMKSCRIGSTALSSRRRVVRMLIVIVVTFAICNLPYHGRKLWQIWSSSYEGGSIFSTLFTPITFLIMYTNCAINPILYAFMSTAFRASFRDLISCRLRHQQRPQEHPQRYSQQQSQLSHHRT